MAKSKNRSAKVNNSDIALSSLESESIEQKTNKIIDAKEKLANYQKTVSGIVTKDAFQNEMARIGFGQPNLSEGATYPLTRMTFNYNLFNSMYRGSWIVRKIIDVVPADMLKMWIKIITQAEPDKIKKLEKQIRQTATKAKIMEGLRWGRLYGGAAGLIVIDGDQDKLDEAINYDEIMVDSYKGLMIFDRWSGVYPDAEKVTDINSIEFGLPKFYTITTENGAHKVHHTRILRFSGRPLPYWEKQAEVQWGESEIEVIFEELKKRDNTSYNIAYLVFLANIRVLKMADLGEVMASSNEEGKKSLYNVLEAQNWLMSNMGMYVMDKEDEFVTEQYSFGGLNDIYESFMLDVAGACEMPVTKLFGRAPAGFNSTGESDLKQYYETIESKQEEYLAPLLDKLMPIIAMSCWGEIPDDLEWEFNPVMVIDNKDLADLSQSYTSQVLEAFNAGVVKKSTALKELKQQSELTGMWTNITDSDIEEAEEETPMSSGEDISNMENEIITGMEKNKQPNVNTQGESNSASEAKSEPQEDTWRTKIANKFGIS